MKESKQYEERFIEYLESCKKLIIKIARIYCKDTEDRKDLVQDIILQLWKSFPKYDSTYAITTWTCRIALNVSISFLRKATSRYHKLKSYQEQVEMFEVSDTVVDEDLEKLYTFIELLKPTDKAIIILYLEGCKNKEISSIMGMSDTNISTRKQRIQDKMKLYFETNKQQYNEI